jgi:hypothetical protein
VRVLYPFLTASLLAGSALASPSARLVYVRAPEANACPDEEGFRKAVAARLGYDPFFPAAQKTVIARINRGAKGYAGSLQIVDSTGALRGERELGVQGENCGELVTSLALAVSIAIDDLDESAQEQPPAAPSTPTEPARVPEPEPATPVIERPPVRTVTRRPDEATAHWSGALGGGPAVYAGTSEGTAFGFALAGTLWMTPADARWKLGARLEGRAELPVQTKLPGVVPVPTGTATATTQLVATGLSLCASLSLPFACVGAAVGRLRSETAGIAEPKVDSIATLAVTARLGVQVPLGRVFFLAPTLEGQVSPKPPSIFVNGSSALTLTVLAGGVSLHVGGQIP